MVAALARFWQPLLAAPDRQLRASEWAAMFSNDTESTPNLVWQSSQMYRVELNAGEIWIPPQTQVYTPQPKTNRLIEMSQTWRASQKSEARPRRGSSHIRNGSNQRFRVEPSSQWGIFSTCVNKKEKEKKHLHTQSQLLTQS